MTINPRSSNDSKNPGDELSHQEVADLSRRLSAARLEIYKQELRIRGIDKDLDKSALLYHRWNTTLSSALRSTLEQFELILRNSIDEHLVKDYGDQWYKEKPWAGNYKLVKAIENIQSKASMSEYGERTSERSIHSKARGKLRLGLNRDNLVAELPFSYWIGFFRERRFRDFAMKIFSHKPPSVNDKEILKRLDMAHDLRNMIAHYEPIILLDIPEMEKELIEFIHWICPTSAAWVKRNSSVDKTFSNPPI